MRAFLDESSCVLGAERQLYLVGAAILEAGTCDDVREELRPLLLPGQVKLHWTDESTRRRQRIVDAIVSLEPINVIVSHVSERQHKTERFRRKCLEQMYYEFVSMELHDVTLESRSPTQDGKDLAHIIALRSRGLDERIRLSHRRGGDEPLLWIADAVLGAVNSARLGDPAHLDALRGSILLQERTPESLGE
ncbi:hypothetical protein ACFFF6_01275 [Brachybacterium hainanense]|uniref:DUF3800 domain-containing protein n=2 Tax=Brachybacterium hainanense TaxID=1541174 RepID=A0ABV6R6G6_9MICO